jgi:hypothetical protein
MPDWYLLNCSLEESIPAQTEVPTIIGTKRLMPVSATNNSQLIIRPTVRMIAGQVFIVV